jgi:hypothetical protein
MASYGWIFAKNERILCYDEEDYARMTCTLFKLSLFFRCFFALL